MSATSEVFSTSLVLPVGEEQFRCSGLPDWVLVDSLAYMVDVRNKTTAEKTMPDGLQIQVSFLIADPPRLSYCCICCPNRDKNPFASVPRIVSSVEDLVLIEVEFTPCIRECFVYEARGGKPSLHLIPDFRPYSQKDYLGEAFGIIAHNNGFVLAALTDTKGEYYMHTFHSRLSTWTRELLEVDHNLSKKPKPINPTNVISLGDGKLGWVDLWKGILIVDVLALANVMPTVSMFIPLPLPLPRNQELYQQHDSARPIRCVTFSHGQLKCVELEQLVRLIPKSAPVVHDPSHMLRLYDDESYVFPDQEEEDEYEVVGWRLFSWFRGLTWDHWDRGSVVYSDDLGPNSFPQKRDMQMCYPTMRCDDVVYLISMQDKLDKNAWIVPVDTKNKSVSKPMAFSAHRHFLLLPTHIPCVLTKYLDTKSEFMAAVDQESLPDISTSRFTWKIESISKHGGGKLLSDVFLVGGYSWRVLVFPTGNNVHNLSMYLDVAGAKSLPNGWSRSAQFSLAVINQLDNKHSSRKALYTHRS